MTPAIQGIVSDLCHALGVDMKTCTRISIMPNRVVVDLVDHTRMIEYTKTFDGPAVVQAESLARREQRAAARHAD
jgi:hypothetical protein